MINRYLPGLLIFAAILYIALGPYTTHLKETDVNNRLSELETVIDTKEPGGIRSTVETLLQKRAELGANRELDEKIADTFIRLFSKLRAETGKREENEDLDGAILAAEKAQALASAGNNAALKRNIPQLKRQLKGLNYNKHFTLGKAQFEEEDYQAAVKSLEAARKYKSSPELEELLIESQYIFHRNSGRLEAANNRFSKALHHLYLANTLKPSPTLKKQLRYLEKEKRLQQLRPTAQQLARDKKSAEALLALKEIKALEGKKIRPFDLLREAAYTNNKGYPEVRLGGIRFVYIHGGEFNMGCFHAGDRLKLDDALPVHRVKLNSFWISVTEITWDQYKGSGGRWPARHLTWDNARSFARKLARNYQIKADLPTEAQWEYVARGGGKEIPYPWGYGTDCSKANYKGCGRVGNDYVGTYPGNKWGVVDLAGNVREWCRDVYSKNYYKHSPRVAPYNRRGGNMRVVRGGCYDDGPQWALKTYFRYYRKKDTKEVYTGFRLVLER